MKLNTRTIRGSALLSALFIMTLVAIAATAMTTRLQLDIYRTRLLINSDKRYLASQAVSFWAISQLKEKKINYRKADKQAVIALFPKNLESIYPNLSTQGYLVDLQSKFNINSLNNKKSIALFNHLLETLFPEQTTQERRAMIEAIQHWISPYKPETGRDAYDAMYLKKSPPYRPSHQAMKSITELRLVAGIRPKIYERLLPYVAALPDDKISININTAPKPILMALGNGLDEAQAEELIQARGKEGFKNIQKITELLKKLNIDKEQITTESEYYLSVAKVSDQELSLTNYSMFKRENGNKRSAELKNGQNPKDIMKRKQGPGKIKVQLLIETINSL